MFLGIQNKNTHNKQTIWYRYNYSECAGEADERSIYKERKLCGGLLKL